MKQALLSNKQDTENAINVIGSLQEEIDNLKLKCQLAENQLSFYKEKIAASECQYKRNTWLVPVCIMGAATVPSVLLMADKNTMGLYTFAAAAVVSISWESGHLIFKWW